MPAPQSNEIREGHSILFQPKWLHRCRPARETTKIMRGVHSLTIEHSHVQPHRPHSGDEIWLAGVYDEESSGGKGAVPCDCIRLYSQASAPLASLLLQNYTTVRRATLRSISSDKALMSTWAPPAISIIQQGCLIRRRAGVQSECLVPHNGNSAS